MRSASGLLPWVAPWLCAFGAACASGPERRSATRAPDDPFVACVAPHRVEVARDAAGTAIVRPLGVTPPELSGLGSAADRCGPWTLDEATPAHVRVLIAHERCGGACPAGRDGWEAELARAAARAPTTSTRCEVRADASWAAWAVGALLDAPRLTPERWVERALILGRAGIGTAEEHIEARLAELDPSAAGELARAALRALPFGAESLRFTAAQALARAGDAAGARSWFNQIAETGRTAFRSFARAELERMDTSPEPGR